MILKKLFISVLFQLFFFSLSSQTIDLNSGVMLGFSNYQGDLVDSPLFDLGESNFAAGAYLRANYKHDLSGRLNIMYAGLSGEDSDRGFSFTSSVFEVTGLVEWELPLYEIKPYFRPYIFTGLGFSSVNQDVDFGKNNITDAGTLAKIELDEKQVADNGLVLSLPIGVGIRRKLNDKFYVELETAYRITANDYLDGISESGNPDANDWWLSGSVGVGYQFTLGKDRDGDGVSDSKDKCPTVPGLKSTAGCPDSDGDGIADRRDRCPELPGPIDLKGCPDSDGDSLVDPDDDCPYVPGAIALKGCPDSDGDGIIDMEDQCPNAAGSRSLSGCPDSDGDGVSDPNDNCPNKRGTVANFGCPEKE